MRTKPCCPSGQSGLARYLMQPASLALHPPSLLHGQMLQSPAQKSSVYHSSASPGASYRDMYVSQWTVYLNIKSDPEKCKAVVTRIEQSNLHIHEIIVTLLEIPLLQTNAHRKLRLGRDPRAFDPFPVRNVASLVHGQMCSMARNSSALHGESHGCGDGSNGEEAHRD